MHILSFIIYWASQEGKKRKKGQDLNFTDSNMPCFLPENKWNVEQKEALPSFSKFWNTALSFHTPTHLREKAVLFFLGQIWESCRIYTNVCLVEELMKYLTFSTLNNRNVLSVSTWTLHWCFLYCTPNTNKNMALSHELTQF